MTQGFKELDIAVENARRERILAMKRYRVMRQDPQDGGLARVKSEAQVVVGSPEEGRLVIAYCGPADDVRSVEEATLFVAAPHLYHALIKAYHLLDVFDDRDPSFASAPVFEQIRSAIALAHADVTFEDD